MAMRRGPRGAARHSRSNPMAIVVPVIFIIVIIVVIVLIAGNASSPTAGVESVCENLMSAVENKNRNSIVGFAGMSNQKAGEQLAAWASGNDIIRWEVTGSTAQGDHASVTVHVVFNPSRDAMLGKTENQQITNMIVKFSWESGRWVLTSHQIQ